jgi:hypothetical protein
MFGAFPQWNPYLFGGLPFVDAMHGDIFYPTTFLKFIMPGHRAMGWKIVLHVFLAGVFTFHWLRHLGIGRGIATFGGVAYLLAPVLVSLVYPGHDGKLFVTALTPLALWVTDWAITRGEARRFAVLALVVALLVFTAHMQLAYFTVWAIVALAVYRLVEARRGGQPTGKLMRRLGGLAAAGVVGALFIGAIQLWTPVRYLTKYSQRVEKTTEAEVESGYAYSTSWSLHPEEAFSLVVPEFIGQNLQTERDVTNTYWGRNPFKLNHEYAGLLPLLLVPVALLARRRRGEVWLFSGIAAVSLVYALGATTPLFRLFYWLVPGVKLFRAPSSIMFIFAIAVITAAALGLEALGRQREEDPDDESGIGRRVSLYLWGVFGVFVVLAVMGSAGILTDLWTGILYRGIAPAKASALESNLPNIKLGLWVGVFLTGVLAGAWHLRRRGSLPRAAWLGIVIALVVVDLGRVNGQFIRVINPALIFPRDDATDFLLTQRQGAEPFRVFPLPSAPYQLNHFAFYGLEELAGHHGNELGRYRDMTQIERLAAQDFRFLRMLNVRYLVSGALLQAPGVREVFRGQRSLVYELEGYHPRAMLVPKLEVVEDSLALGRMLDPSFDPRAQVLISEGAAPYSGDDANGRVRWGERGLNEYTLEVESDAPALLLLSDNFYPSWRARVDGEPVSLLRADYTMRAVEVPAGSHTVVLEYSSPLFKAAVWTTFISLLAVISLIVAPLVLGVARHTAALSEAEGAA